MMQAGPQSYISISTAALPRLPRGGPFIDLQASKRAADTVMATSDNNRSLWRCGRMGEKIDTSGQHLVLAGF